ncbi:hypothetical protein [Chryseobacterium caseinilyticum]|uniref:Uncharacterized protein n=1 Tax=Chryseobacterium caseinilyticum TaxID=2771428 RepID=A0ABR8Z8B9_9FLAO|nr:hypothetical protein [Chryseobacterium caseinilyticum]MBD8081514.1 hypothetical protein [Chryseobacterium caseinilyticum]
MKPKNIPGVPKQVKGGFHDSESFQKSETEEDVEMRFHHLKERFFSINQWKEYCPESRADFKLCNLNGNIVERLPQEGDYIRIDIPGPGGKEGRSFDWTVIDKIDFDSPNRLLIQCRPSPDPVKFNSKKIAHFYCDKSTSTFVIERNLDMLMAAVYGRNESPNLKSGFINSARNVMIAVGGIFGLSKIQWECLAEGMLKGESE